MTSNPIAITYHAAIIEADGRFNQWYGPLNLNQLLDRVEFWRGDKQDTSVAMVVTESHNGLIANIQVFDKTTNHPEVNDIVKTFMYDPTGGGGVLYVVPEQPSETDPA